MRNAFIATAITIRFLAAPSRLALAAIQYDPLSSESDDKQTEWVEIHNAGPDAVDLEGFQLTSGSAAKPHDAKQRYVFGKLVIAPDQYLAVGVGTRQSYDGLGLPTFAAYCDET